MWFLTDNSVEAFRLYPIGSNKCRTQCRLKKCSFKMVSCFIRNLFCRPMSAVFLVWNALTNNSIKVFIERSCCSITLAAVLLVSQIDVNCGWRIKHGGFCTANYAQDSSKRTWFLQPLTTSCACEDNTHSGGGAACTVRLWSWRANTATVMNAAQAFHHTARPRWTIKLLPLLVQTGISKTCAMTCNY